VAAIYLDTSALGRVLLGEPDAPAIRDALARFSAHVSSRLLAVELRRLGLRHGRDSGELLRGVALIPLTEAVLRAAEALPPDKLRALDAIHLATLLATHDTATPVTAIMTYDRELQAAAREHRLDVVAPGARP
jgi:predicted nucleic acid-binding protein